ncbi:MAG: hypothetical protein KF819_37880 [Labilithrix sp.]|nr:hypothetical protein [Labilithrix sp.]
MTQEANGTNDPGTTVAAAPEPSIAPPQNGSTPPPSVEAKQPSLEREAKRATPSPELDGGDAPPIAPPRPASRRSGHGARAVNFLIVVWIVSWCLVSAWFSMATLSAYQLSDELRQDGAPGPALGDETARPLVAQARGSESAPESELPRKAQSGSRLALLLRYTNDIDELKELEARLSREYEATENRLKETLARSASVQVESTALQMELAAATDLRTKLARLEDQRAELRRRQAECTMSLQSGSLLLANETLTGMSFFKPRSLLPLTPDLLTLILAMAMGVLGASLRSLRDFLLERHDRTLLWFLFRPPLGMITAFSVLVLFKAGQLSITAGPPGTLNPYVISFVSMVSGILADEAYERLRSAGHSVFGRGRDGAADRWAAHVKSVLEAKGKKPADLAGVVGRTYAGELSLWLDEKKPVPPEHQRLIAVWLETPAWQLFTDFSPAERNGDHDATTERT